MTQYKKLLKKSTSRNLNNPRYLVSNREDVVEEITPKHPIFIAVDHTQTMIQIVLIEIITKIKIDVVTEEDKIIFEVIFEVIFEETEGGILLILQIILTNTGLDMDIMCFTLNRKTVQSQMIVGELFRINHKLRKCNRVHSRSTAEDKQNMLQHKFKLF